MTRGRSSRGFAWVLAAATLAVSFCADAPAQARPLIGVTEAPFTGPPGDVEAQRVDELGAETFRLGISWSDVQPRSGGPYNWRDYDQLATALHARGIRPILLLMNSPSWAQNQSDLCLGSPGCPPAPDQVGAWAAFVRAAVQHFATGAGSVDPIGVEVWNEENVKTNWYTFAGPDAARYASLLEAAANASRAVRPDLPIVLGGLSAGGASAPAFIYDLARLGARSSYDAIGLHPYPDPGPGDTMQTMLATFDASVSTVREARDAVGDGAKPLWITEVGIVDPDEVVGGQSQASEILAMYEDAAKQSDIATFVIHRLRNGLENKDWGLLNPDWSPRPSFNDLAARFTADRAAARAAQSATSAKKKPKKKAAKRRCTAKRSKRTGRRVLVCPKKTAASKKKAPARKRAGKKKKATAPAGRS